MATGLSVVQKAAILRVYRVHPAVSFSVTQKVVREALIRRGYAVAATVPLSLKQGLQLTKAGVFFARTGEEML